MKRGRKTASDIAGPPPTDVRADWQKRQGAECACGGADDMCRCQNEQKPWVSQIDRLRRRVRELEGEVSTLRLQQQTDRQTIANYIAMLATAPRPQGEGQAAGPEGWAS